MIDTKSPPAEPKAKLAAEEPDALIDTSKMSNGQRAALELTEAAREVVHDSSFASGLFMGSFRLPAEFPAQRAEDRDQGYAFLEKLAKLLRAHVDPDEID